MAKSQGDFNKKEREKQKLQKKKEKEQRKEERRANAKEGKSLEDMMAYVDEYGNITSTPPDQTRKQAVKQEDIEIGSRNRSSAREAGPRTGRVTFFNQSKGYGFIKDLESEESIFVHVNAVDFPIKENDMVTFETQRGVKGLMAVQVKKK